jgi:hypothetical protein
VTFTGTVTVFCDYPAGKSVNLDASGKAQFAGNSYEDFAAIAAPTYTEGRVWYDSTQKALAYYNDVTNNTLHIGEEIQLKVYNNTGSTINIGQPVYVTSTSSSYTYPNVALAIANSLTTANVIGLANQAIPTGTAGYVTTIGLIQGLNTGSYTVGDTLYLSPYSAGYYQNTIPPTGYAIKLGTVAYVNSSNGSIYINKSILSVQAGNIVGQVALANGGTNANLTATAGAVPYSTSTAMAFSAVGTSGQVLTSQGTSAPIWSTVSATPAGSNTQVQYNNSGALGASSSFTFNSSTGALTAPEVVASNGLVVNSGTVSTSYSIPSGNNAMAVGPITVASGQTVTVPSGSRWVVL